MSPCPKLALFDLDHTLLPIDSDHAWGEFTADMGWVDALEFKKQNDQFFEQYKAGTLEGAEYVRFATQAFVERGPAQALAAREVFMAQVIEPHIRPEALALLDAHRKAGDQIIIVTATNEFVTRPIASRMGVAELIAVKLQRNAAHWFTQDIDGVPSMKAGKVTRVEQWLADRGWQWADVPHATFYTDSMNDIALMERVHTAVATNPSPALRACAHERGWRVLDLFTKDNPN
jgi:HAD superfamily hydrolase (TIGR01490 family)